MSNELTIAIIAAICGSLAIPLAQTLLHMLRYWVLGKKTRVVSGKWKTNWSFSDQDKSESHIDRARLYQIGSYVWGSASDDVHKYSIKARFNLDGYLHGTFKDTQASTDWYGSFKLLMRADGRSMEGKWLGRSRSSVRSGDWKWEKIN